MNTTRHRDSKQKLHQVAKEFSPTELPNMRGTRSLQSLDHDRDGLREKTLPGMKADSAQPDSHA